jgi:hypothetical protein
MSMFTGINNHFWEVDHVFYTRTQG